MSERRAALAAETARRTGIDDQMIMRLVFTFYRRIREDDLLGPIFEAHVEDWPQHLYRMCAFWSSVALMSGRYHGQPMPKHMPLPIDGRHFDHWLALFETTANEVCPPAAAAHFIARARSIAKSLELALASHLGERLEPAGRLRRPDEEIHLPHPPAPPRSLASSPCAMPEIETDDNRAAAPTDASE